MMHVSTSYDPISWLFPNTWLSLTIFTCIWVMWTWYFIDFESCSELWTC